MDVYDLVDLGSLNSFVRSLDFDSLVLSQYLPNVPYDRTSFRVMTNSRDQQAAARFIAPDVEAPIGGRPGLVERTGAMPPIKQKSVLTESDQYALEALQGQVSPQLLATVYSDAALRARAIMQRFELARGEVLSTGALTILDGRLNLTVDMGVPAPHMDVAPATLWSDTATSDPLDDMITWRDLYNANTGEDPGTALTSTTVLSLLQRNQALIAAAVGSTIGRTRINRTELNGVLTSEGLPAITTYDSQYKDVGGVMQRAIAANRFLFLPSNPADLGETQLGRTREAVELATNGVSVEGGLPGLVVTTQKTWDPVNVWIKAAAIGIPTLQTPELLFSAVVTA